MMKLEEYAKDPLDPVKNFDVGYEYEKIGQTASAVSFYIRAAEKSNDSRVKFESMIRAAKCFDSQGRRNFSTEGLLQFAVAAVPNRSEAYYFLSKLYHKMEKWRECSLYAQLGLQYESYDDMRTNIEFPGKYALIYEKAFGDWNIGLYEKSKQALYYLKYDVQMDEEHERLVNELLAKNGYPDTIPYDASRYKFSFDGIETVDQNYSKHMQDMFVLTALNGKKNGTYLEIGSGDPIVNNNTYLLEKNFGWKGISLDQDRDHCNQFFTKRKNPVVRAQSLDVNYFELLDNHCMPYEIDYLQIDCDDDSYQTLRRIPFDDFKFAVIHFEHDMYIKEPKIREYSRNILKDNGYVLVVNDVAINEKDSHEDWWVHPDIVDTNTIEKLKSKDAINFVGTYMFRHEKKVSKSLLDSFVPNILSLETCGSRRNKLTDAFNRIGTNKYRMNVFKKIEDTNIDFVGNDNHIELLPLGVFTSHLLTIKKWYDETQEEFGLFFEDDVSFDNMQYWNFSLQEFVSKLPSNCDAIQLSCIYQVDPDIRVRRRDHLDHGIQAYILKRNYAKKLLDDLIVDKKTISVKDPYVSLSVENYIMHEKYGNTYSFPLFNHNVKDFNSTIVGANDNTKNLVNGQSHLAVPSYETVFNWWKNTGSKLTLDQIMEL